VDLIEGSTFAGTKFLTWYVWPVQGCRVCLILER
jgi:hypothetical protein